MQRVDRLAGCCVERESAGVPACAGAEDFAGRGDVLQGDVIALVPAGDCAQQAGSGKQIYEAAVGPEGDGMAL